MNQLKRNFSAFQNESKQSNVSSTGSKKVKLTSEPNIKVYTRFRPISKEDYSGMKMRGSKCNVHFRDLPGGLLG